MNIREVARKAGVGIGTVSRVLNGRTSVSPVQQRVLEVVKALKYTPNIHARRMWRGRTNTICFILANRQILLSLHGHIFHGVENSAGSTSTVSCSQRSGIRPTLLRRSWSCRRFSGTRELSTA